MTEVFSLKCDRCGKLERGEDLERPKGWARVSIDLRSFHYCPECWQAIEQGKGVP